MLPDEVLKEIENGPREDRTGHISVHEGSEDFATRIAELALRRYAITKLARKLTPFELASMVGHKDLRMTLNVYYRSDPEEIAGKLG